jgi:hypothetical protein
VYGKGYSLKLFEQKALIEVLNDLQKALKCMCRKVLSYISSVGLKYF